MPVKAADPGAQEMDKAFADAMAGPAKPRGPDAPPAIDHEAPHGRDEHGEPKTPYGVNKDGSVKKSPAGRKAKDPDSAARTGTAQPSTPGDTPDNSQLSPKDFSASLMDAGESLWFGGSVIAKVGPQVPLVGRFIPGAKLSATMAVFDSERPRLAAALNEAAQHDARARKLAEKLAAGDTGWALTCMFMVAPFAGAVAAIWQGDQALADRELPSLAVLAKSNEDAMDKMLAKISQQMELAQKLAQEMAADPAAQEMVATLVAQNGRVTADA